VLQVCNERWKSEHKGWIFFDMEEPYSGLVLRLQVLLDLFFIADIFVNFRTAYLDEKTGKYVKDSWKIAAHYSRHWLLCDLFCAIPLDVLLDESPHIVVGMDAPRKKGKTWLKWLLRRTGALHMLRVAADTGPFKGARRVGKFFVHGRRVMRAFGGLLQTVRGMRSARHVLSFKAALHGFLFLRDMGVLGIFRNASVAAQTFAGSFAFLRLLVSLTIRGASTPFHLRRRTCYGSYSIFFSAHPMLKAPHLRTRPSPTSHEKRQPKPPPTSTKHADGTHWRHL
jgi:hypothetical protein